MSGAYTASVERRTKLPARALAAARPHVRAEIAAEIAEALRDRETSGAMGAWLAAASFVEREFVSVRPDNEEAKP